MGKRAKIRPVAAILVVLFLALVIALFHDSERLTLPSGGRTKLPTGPVKPMVSLGATHGLILAGDGSLWSWGTNYLGWPVLGMSNVAETPYLHRIGSDTNWISISAGGSHNVAVKADGTLWAWGMNIYGEFGTGSTFPRAVTNPVLGPPGNDWKQAAAGGSHTIALKKDGTIWAWGNNWAGQLGIGGTNDSFVPAQIGMDTNWVRVWADGLHGAAQRSDGSLWIWGSNPALTNQPARTNSNLLSPVRLSADTNWVSEVFGQDVFLAVQSDGTLWVWGRGAHCYNGGQSYSLNGTLTRVGTNSDWRSVCSSQESRCQLLTRKDGSLWGLEAGFAAPTNAPPPLRWTRIDLPKGFAALDATRGSAGVVLTTDGEVWTWGRAMGESTRARPLFQRAATVARKLGFNNAHWGDPQPVVRNEPWLLPNIDPDALPK